MVSVSRRRPKSAYVLEYRYLRRFFGGRPGPSFLPRPPAKCPLWPSTPRPTSSCTRVGGTEIEQAGIRRARRPGGAKGGPCRTARQTRKFFFQAVSGGSRIIYRRALSWTPRACAGAQAVSGRSNPPTLHPPGVGAPRGGQQPLFPSRLTGKQGGQLGGA